MGLRIDLGSLICLVGLTLQALPVADSFSLPASQRVLIEPQSGAPFTLSPQTEEICKAGSKQWTGSINVTDDKSIFYCKAFALISNV